MSTPYNMAFACLKCCKSFKRECNVPPNEYPEKLPCPECGGEAHNYGRHFKPPKKNDSAQWKKITFLHEHGFRFHKIRVGPGHHDVVPYPENMAQAKEFVVKYKKYAANV